MRQSDVIKIVARELKVERRDILAPSRSKADIAWARQVAMYLCHTQLKLSMSAVGRFFKRDRTTVSHACRKVEAWRDLEDLDMWLEKIENECAASVVRAGERVESPVNGGAA